MNNPQLQLIDIYDVWYHPWWNSTKFTISLYILVGILMVAMLYYWYLLTWYRRKLSFDKQALLNLQQLTAYDFSDEKQLKNAYFALTLIFKSYVAQRYNLSLHDKSDIEVIAMIQPKLSQPQNFLISEFLTRAFQIKFALQPAGLQMLQDDIDFVKKFIVQTMVDYTKNA
jgi:hypothetical protein